jgi:hypothetical protein
MVIKHHWEGKSPPEAVKVNFQERQVRVGPAFCLYKEKPYLDSRQAAQYYKIVNL